MRKVRLGIVGLGNIGKFHTGYLLDQKISHCELAAVSDAFAPGPEPYKNKCGLKTFASCAEMIRSKEIDAIVIADGLGAQFYPVRGFDGSELNSGSTRSDSSSIQPGLGSCSSTAPVARK